MENPLTAHCRSVGETYGQHFIFAASFGTRMVLGGMACIVHAVLPFCFLRTGSTTVLKLYERIGTGAQTHSAKPRQTIQHGHGRFVEQRNWRGHLKTRRIT